MLLWWPILWLFILLYCIEGTVYELEVVDCTLEFTLNSSSNLFSVTEMTFFGFGRRPTVFLNSNNNNNNSRYCFVYIEGSWQDPTICILGQIPLYTFTTILPICFVIELTLTNIIAKYDQNLKSTKK